MELERIPVAEEVVRQLRAAVGERNCISDPEQLRTYECDGLTSFRAPPGVVVVPGSTEEVVKVVRIARAAGLPIVPRGSGTGLSGGAMPIPGCVLVSLARMRRIVAIDLKNGTMRVEPGVINLDVSKRLAPDGYYYAPDPSSQSVCTIGGNVAENSGGAHCLKYGFTVNHVGGALLMDADGCAAEVEHVASRAAQIAKECGALQVRLPKDEAERQTMWKGRKSAFAAVGRISPNYVVQDGVIPRSEIAKVLREIEALSKSSGLRIANVFHAGDGNLHPLVLYDEKVH